MAFNWSTFKTRAGTAVIFAVLMIAGLLWNQWSFLVLFSIIHFGCWWEYLLLTQKIYKTIFHPYTRLGFMLIGFGIMLWFCGPAFRIMDYGLKDNLSLPVSAAGFAMLVMGIFQRKAINLKAFGAAALGLLYISLSCGLMMDLYSFEVNNSEVQPGWFYPMFFPVIIIGCMWINDTMAYLVGSIIGKTPLSKISPKKTWEGTIGGIILSTLIMGWLASVLDEWFSFGSLAFYIGFALVAVIAGTFGDLLESKIKRMAGVKDSGTLMPGHGGFLDRFDSLLLATPFAWLYLQLFA